MGARGGIKLYDLPAIRKNPELLEKIYALFKQVAFPDGIAQTSVFEDNKWVAKNLPVEEAYPHMDLETVCRLEYPYMEILADFPFLRYPVLRISYGTNVSGFPDDLQDLLLDHHIHPEATIETWT